MSKNDNPKPAALTLNLKIEGKCCEVLHHLANEEKLPAEEVAARMLKQALENSELLMLRRDIGKLRQDFAVSMEILLVKTCNIPPETARKWVMENLVFV